MQIMQKRLFTLLFIMLLASLSSCTKDSNSIDTKFKEDMNNYFTATFNGKTIKTSGFIFTINGVADDASGSVAIVHGYLLTSNTSNGVETKGMIAVSGSSLNLAYGDLYKIPIQQLDASLDIERIGNAVGSYKLTDSNFPGLYYSSITDLTVGRKKYDLEPSSTSVNITAADALYIQGSYTGKLIDGSAKIPVTGTFKLRKL